MKESIDIMRGARKVLIDLLGGISIEKLNEVPAGFNNNLVWNMAHMIATQQILCYRNAGEKPVVDEEFIDKYKTGTRPGNLVSEEEVTNFKEKLFSTIDQFEKDSKTKMFENYVAREIKLYPGVSIENIRDAAKFAAFHDGLHIGYSMALKRALNK